MCLTILKRAQEGNTPQEEGGEVVMYEPRTKEDCLEFIEELGSRFPDLSDDAVTRRHSTPTLSKSNR